MALDNLYDTCFAAHFDSMRSFLEISIFIKEIHLRIVVYNLMLKAMYKTNVSKKYPLYYRYMFHDIKYYQLYSKTKS